MEFSLSLDGLGLLVLGLLAAGCDCRRRLRFSGSEKRKCGRRSSFDHLPGGSIHKARLFKGTIIPIHTHPADEHVLVLSGTLEIEVAALRPCCLVSPPVALRIRWNLGLTCVT